MLIGEIARTCRWTLRLEGSPFFSTIDCAVLSIIMTTEKVSIVLPVRRTL